MQTTDLPLRPTHVEVNLSVLAANLQAIRQKVSPAKVMPVVKANAYGHGIIPVARHMADSGADMLGVAILDEGILLRQAGLKLPVLVLGGIQPYQIPAYLDNDLLLTIGSSDNLQAVAAAAAQRGAPASVHVKIDTGMGRPGAFIMNPRHFWKPARPTPT
ncbi:MAG: alanine racemase [Holophaga sp.]|nr:alanine racemase [Holophaga sp.]